MIDAAVTDARDTLHRVAAHIVARARQQATGRFSLRIAPGGFATPDLDDAGRRVRVSGGTLLSETDAIGGPAAIARSIDGATLRDLAGVAGVDLDAPLSVGHDTPPLGDIDLPIHLDGRAATSVGSALDRAARVLDAVLANLAAGASRAPATLPRLWPEHFDVAIEVPTAQGRVNLGGSPGDGFCDEPYWYVGPWDPVRPGDPAFWNAPFGAFTPFAALATDDDAVGFLLRGLDLLDRPG